MTVVFSCCHCPYVVAWEDLPQRRRARGRRPGGLPGHQRERRLPRGRAGGHEIGGPRRRASSFPFLYDETQETATAYGAARTPEVFVFDAEHRLAYHGAPDSNHQDPEGAEPYLRPALAAVLAGDRPAVQETPPVGCTIKWR